MMRIVLATLLLPAAFTGACTSVASYEFVGSSDYELTVPADLKGQIQRIRLETDRYTGGRLVIHRTEMRRVVEAGLTVREFDKPLRAKLESDLRPFAGLYVEAVATDGPAAAVGIAKGDLLLRVGTEALVETGDLEQALRAAAPGSAVELHVRRGPIPAQASPEDTVLLIPEARTEPTRAVERIPLIAADPVDRPVLGVRLGGLPEPWNRRLFQDPADPVVITSVVPGSPAYHAGLRSGDMVFRVDGAPVQGVAAFQRQALNAAAAELRLDLEVRQGNGEPFYTRVVPEPYQGRGSFYFPLVFNWSSDAQDTGWGFGPLGLIAAYRGHYTPSPDRAPRHDSVFSMLLGLFRIEDEGEETHTRLLWFIRWTT